MTLSFSGKPSPIDIKAANAHRSRSPSTPEAWLARKGTTRSDESSNNTTTQQPAGDQYVPHPRYKIPSPTTPKAMNLEDMKSEKG